jgi:hypothetical protein
MKKLILCASIVLILIACDNPGMENNDNKGGNETEYLTVTYHKDKGTTGEAPIDETRYHKPVFIIATGTYDRVDTMTILDQGTMQKKGYIFDSWKLRAPHYTDTDQVWINETYRPGMQRPIDYNFIFDPVWQEKP